MKIHIVREGDSLFDISLFYQVKLEDLEAANPWLTNPDLISPGMKITIPSEERQVNRKDKSVRKEKIMEARPEKRLTNEVEMDELPIQQKSQPRYPVQRIEKEKRVPVKLPEETPNKRVPVKVEEVPVPRKETPAPIKMMEEESPPQVPYKQEEEICHCQQCEEQSRVEIKQPIDECALPPKYISPFITEFQLSRGEIYHGHPYEEKCNNRRCNCRCRNERDDCRS